MFQLDLTHVTFIVSQGADKAEMACLPAASFRMGSDHHYPEEAPERSAHVGAFAMDRFPVTNAQFARFVAATGHITLAEIAPDPSHYPGMRPELARPGSAVFVAPTQKVSLHDPGQWWRYIFGADWRHPEGPGSGIEDRMDHPVVHVAWEDARAYAKWAGKDLPTEIEHEYASRGGLDGCAFAWGDTLAPKGQMLANYWQGEFPCQNTLEDGYRTTSPVGHYRPNGFGLYDMIGNVWEWTCDAYDTSPSNTARSCCGPKNVINGKRDVNAVPAATSPESPFPRKVLKGGSHLCAENYCRRYRPAARHPQQIDSPTSHIGFRCVSRGTGNF